MEHILITGGAKRLGALMARTVARADRRVTVHTGSSIEAAEALVAELIASGCPAAMVQADLHDDAAVEALVERAALAGGRPVTALVNNASTLDYDSATAVAGEVFDQAMRINLKVPLMLAASFVRQKPAGVPGLIVNFLDQKLWNLNPDFYSYTCSKAALQAATTMMAMAYAPEVRVNAIAPGPVLVSFDQSDAEFEAMAASNLLHRPIDPAAIGQALETLLTSPALTGQVLHVDNGQRFQPSARDLIFVQRGG